MAVKPDWLAEADLRLKKMPAEAKALRKNAMEDLFTFACLVNPGRVYGEIHKEVFRWLQEADIGRTDGKPPNKLLLLPRAHMKSHCVAVWCAWYITNNPETTILYLSATAELAEKQLFDIKNIMTSGIYSRFWPDMIHPEEGSRTKWAVAKIAVDHPKRVKEGIRDWTIATAGLTTNTTGWHADVIVPDDVVVPDNAYTEEGRRRVVAAMSQMSSIRNAGGFTVACGTRYHPADIYFTWKAQKRFLYDEETQEIIGEAPIWDIKEHVVETENSFLWPREVRADGKAFGFDLNILSGIKAEYEDTTQFFAQYYNNPNDPGSNRIDRSKFQYYDLKHVKRKSGDWYFKDNKLNVYASIDFAFSLNQRADYSAIVVIGIDCDGNIYVLDIVRFKTDKTIEYFRQVAEMHAKWEFRKLRAEVTVAQQIIVNDLKDYIKKEGMRLSIDEYRPSRSEGSKEERIASTLEHRYDNQAIFHLKGGYTQMLEEELILARPPHDDIKDALASAVAIAIKPKQSRSLKDSPSQTMQTGRSRFGGYL
jgi:hypothetical protein